MEAMRSTWTDSRLDDLNDRVKIIDEKVGRLDAKMDAGFARGDAKMDAGFARGDAKMDAGFGRLDGRIDDLHQSLVYGMVALISIIAVLLTAFLAIVVTRL